MPTTHWPCLLLQMPKLLGAGNAFFASSTASQDLTWDDVDTFYAMEPSLRGDVLAGAGKVVVEKLRGTFLCLEEAWRDEELRETFLQLPLAAVEAIAAMDELQVLSENTVATALASWVAADPSSREEAGPALLRHLRLHHLTQAYIGGVLLKLPGIGKHVTVEQLAAVAQYSKASAWGRARARAFQSLKPARSGIPPSSQLLLEWQIPLADLMHSVKHCLAREACCTATTSLGPTENLVSQATSDWAVQGPDSFYNGFRLTLASGIPPRAQAVAVALLVSAEVASGLPGACFLPAGLTAVELQVCRVEWTVPDGLLQAPFVVGARQCRVEDTDHLAACQLRMLDVGPGAVHDALSLLAGLQLLQNHVTTVSPDQVQATKRVCRLLGPRDQKVLLRCFVNGCD